MHISKMTMTAALAILTAWPLSAPEAMAQSAGDTVLDIYGTQVRPVVVGAPLPTLGQPGPSAEWVKSYDARIRLALAFHGALKPLDRAAELEDSSPAATLKAEVWRAAGAEIVLKTEVRALPDRVEADAYLYDVGAGETILSKRFKMAGQDVAPLADAVAGAVIESLLGDVSPFGQPLAFQYRAPGEKWRELHTTDWLGGNVQKRTQSQKLVLHPSFVPGTEALVAIGYRDKAPALRFFDLAKGTERVLLTSTATMHGTNAFQDGKRVAFAWEQNKNTDVYVLTLETGKWDRLTTSTAADLSPTISPDGKKIVFVSDRRGNPYIYIVDVETKQEEPLIVEGSYLGEPEWSPDGKRLVFVRRDRGTTFSLWTYEFGSKQLDKLTPDLGDSLESPTWAPDSRTIVYSVLDKGSYDLWKVDRQLKTRQKITSLPGDERMPTWRAF